MATGNGSSFFGRSHGTTPSRVSSARPSSRLSTSSALELISAGESQYENRPRRNLGRNTATPRSMNMNAENVLPYQPGMLLQDRPLVYGSGSDSECGEDNIYTFDEHIRPSHRVGPSWNTEITDIKMMVQQQQAMMTSILANQEAMQERQGLYEKKVSQLEEKLVQYSPSSSDASPRTGKKRKRVVNRGVSQVIFLTVSKGGGWGWAWG